jgi:putative sporulation protein YtaF
MQHFVYAFFIALTNNVDNVGARIAYSLGGIRISFPINLWITVITFAISFLAAFFGAQITGTLGKQFSSVIAMVLLVALGCWMILVPQLKKRRHDNYNREKSRNIIGIVLHPQDADMDHSKHIDFKEATLLGIALSINNIGGGLSAGMIGLNALLVGSLSAALSFLALWAGNYVAELFMKWNIAEKTTVAGGVILIAIGIEQLL